MLLFDLDVIPMSFCSHCLSQFHSIEECRQTHSCNIVQRQVSSISQLSTNSGISEDWVHSLGIHGYRSSLEVLHKLAKSHDLTSQAKVLLHRLKWSDGRGRVVRSVEIPCVESGEVLEGSEELVTADGGCDEFEVMGHGGVVDEGIGDHFGSRRRGRAILRVV